MGRGCGAEPFAQLCFQPFGFLERACVAVLCALAQDEGRRSELFVGHSRVIHRAIIADQIGQMGGG